MAKSRYNSGNGKVISAIAVIVAMIVSFVGGSFFGWYAHAGQWFTAEEEPEESVLLGGMELTPSDDGNGVSLLSAKIEAEDFETYGVSEAAESAYLLTATVTPENAVDAILDWTIDFVDPSSEWAAGKTVTDYVTVTPTSDGALTATVACYAEFGEQITVKASIRTNAAVYATCAVDYRQKYVDIAASIAIKGGEYGTWEFKGDKTEMTVIYPSDLIASGTRYNCTVTWQPIFSETYTLAVESPIQFSYGIYAEFSDEYVSALEAAGYAYAVDDSYKGEIDLVSTTNLSANSTLQKMLLGFVDSTSYTNMDKTVFLRSLSQNVQSPMMTYTVYLWDYIAQTAIVKHSWKVYFDESSFDSYAETISMDENLEFGGNT